MHMAAVVKTLKRVLVATTIGTVGAGGAYLIVDENARKAVPNTLDGTWRFTRTTANALITAADYKYSLYGLDKEADEVNYKSALSAANLRAAKRLYKVCHAHGGLYNKFAQYVSTMNHVLPNEFVEILSPLQDKAKEVSKELALEVVKSELKVDDLSDVFSEFDEKPIAAASLAQVHRAVLKHGEEVAVKVQYPHLRDQVRGDLATLELLTVLVGWAFPDYGYSWLVPEFEDTVVLELDFRQEAKNSKRLAKMFAHRKDVYVPPVYDSLTTDRLLVMDFVRGYKPTDMVNLVKNGIPRHELAATVSTVFGDMIHVHGFVHCDPHAGNLLVRRKQTSWSWSSVLVTAFAIGSVPAFALIGAFQTAASAAVVSGAYALYHQTREAPLYELVILDHGMYRRLDPDFRRLYCQLWKALLTRDHELGRHTAISLGVSSSDYDILSLIFTFRSPKHKQATGQRMTKEQRKELRKNIKKVDAGDVNAFMKRLPRDLLFVSRTTNIVRSLNYSLGGTTRQRFKKTGESAVRGLTLENSQLLTKTNEKESLRKDYQGPYRVNLSVASEVDNPHKPLSELFEVYKLRVLIELIDTFAFR